jgi:hypothetical protein
MKTLIISAILVLPYLRIPDWQFIPLKWTEISREARLEQISYRYPLERQHFIVNSFYIFTVALKYS